MVPSIAINNIADGAFPDTKQLSKSDGSVLSCRVKLSYLGNLCFIQLCASIAFTLRAAFTQSNPMCMLDVFFSCAILKILRAIVSFIAVLMVDFAKSFVWPFPWIYRHRWHSKERKCHKMMNFFGMSFPVFPKVYCIVFMPFVHLYGTQLPDLSSTGWIETVNRFYPSKRGDFINIFKSWYWFPYFHFNTPKVLSRMFLYYSTLLNRRDWRAASERVKSGNFAESLRINRERFGADDMLSQIFEHTRKELDW